MEPRSGHRADKHICPVHAFGSMLTWGIEPGTVLLTHTANQALIQRRFIHLGLRSAGDHSLPPGDSFHSHSPTRGTALSCCLHRA